jgi:hypothetical protein
VVTLGDIGRVCEENSMHHQDEANATQKISAVGTPDTSHPIDRRDVLPWIQGAINTRR